MSDFLESDKDIWDEEEIEASIFNAFYALNSEVFTVHPLSRTFTFRDNFVCKTVGCYFPPKDRVFYKNCLDVRNDGMPLTCTFSGAGDYFDISYHERVGRRPDLSTVVIFPIKKLPKGVKGLGSDFYYKLLHWEFYEDGVEQKTFRYAEFDEKSVKNSNMLVSGCYVGINSKDDRIIPVIDPKWVYNRYKFSRQWIKSAFSLCVNAYLDARYLWNVDCYYQYGKNLNVWLKFGVYEEHIKSLLYSRDLPVTASGRKRPIQHWVKAHKRRIKKGTDITQVKKHLRGINRFEMFGYKFLISNPMKKDLLPELEKREFDIAKALSSPPYTDIEQVMAN